MLTALFFQNEGRRVKLLRQLVAARLQDRLAGSVSVGKRRFRFLVMLLGLAGVIAALAQPRMGYTWEQTQRKGRDVILAIDCSKSMLATDLAPNRLGRAKLAAQDLIGELQGDRAGLIAFAGSAFLQAPLTVDYSAVLNSLGELDTDIIPRGGTNIAAAIKTAVEAFGKGESDNRALILFTDGEELDEDAVKAAAELNGAVRIFTIGLGSADGSLIPVPGANGGTDFVKDESGQIVKSRLDEDRLRKIAEATGGFYVHLTSGPAETLQIVRDGLGQMKEQDLDAKMSRRPIERYQWPLSGGLLLLAASMLIGERKRAARREAVPAKALAAVGVFLLSVFSSHASPLNPGVKDYSEGLDLLNKGRQYSDGKEAAAANVANDEAKKHFESAYQEFGKQLQRQPSSPAMNFNRGVAAYRLGKDEEALDLFAKALLADERDIQRDAEGYLGNTLYRSGNKRTAKQEKLKDWKNSVAHYDSALKITPDHKLIRRYRDWVQKKIDELEKEPPKSEDKKDQDKKDEQKKDNKNEDQKQPKDGQNQSDQKQNPQDKQKQDQKQDQQKNQQDQQSPGDQPQQDKQSGEEKKDDQGKPDKKDGKQDDSKQQNGDKPDDKKDGSKKPQPQGQAKTGEQKKDGEKGEQPKPSPDEPNKKLAGDIKPQNGQQPQPQPDPQQQEAEEAQAAAEGKMTEAQAKGLLDSLKGEDTKVQLLKPGERKAGGRVLKDW